MRKLAIAALPASGSPEALPLGAACVAAAVARSPALQGKVAACLVEGLPGEGGEDLASRIASSGADWAAFSVFAWSREASAGAARALRAALPGALLFAGGPEATADPASLLAEGAFDFVVAGEGEGAAVSALEAVFEEAAEGAASPLGEALAARLAAMPGIALPGRPFRRAPPEDPGQLPSPWLSGTLDPASRGGDLLWELARGCPYRCAYCYESKGERGVRPLPMERVEAELELFARSGARYVFVLDPTFNADRGRAKAILSLMRRRGPGIRWKLELRAELLDAATAGSLARLDCSLQVGLQSARPETLALIGRGFDRGAFSRGMALLERAGLSFGLDLIYGLPGDTLRDFEASLDWALGFGPNHLDLFPLAVLPGTELAERAGELGLEASGRPPYLVRATREMPGRDLERAAALARACDRFYSAGRAVGWFRASLAPLREAPSAFLRRYAGSFPEAARDSGPGAASPPQAAVEAEQLAFLERSYAEADRSKLWPALRDLVMLHGAMSRAMAEGLSAELDLSYDPDEILGASPAGLAKFASSARARLNRVRVLPDELDGFRLQAIPRGRGESTRSPELGRPRK